MMDNQIEQAQKSLKWVVNQIPEDLGDSEEEKMLKCIRLYCENGVEAINLLKSENAEATELCKKKFSDLSFSQWLRLMALAKYDVEAQNQEERDNQIREDAIKEILQELLGFVGSNQKFCIVDDNHKNLIETDGLLSTIENIAKKYGVDIEQ